MDGDGNGSIDFEEFANWYLAAEAGDGGAAGGGDAALDAALADTPLAMSAPMPARHLSDASIGSGDSGGRAAMVTRSGLPARGTRDKLPVLPAMSRVAGSLAGSGRIASALSMGGSGRIAGGAGAGPGATPQVRAVVGVHSRTRGPVGLTRVHSRAQALPRPLLPLVGSGNLRRVVGAPMTVADLIVERVAGTGPDLGRGARPGSGLIPGHYVLGVTGYGSGPVAKLSGPPPAPTGAGLIGEAKFRLLKLRLRALRGMKETFGITDRLMAKRAYISRSRVGAEVAARAAFRRGRPPPAACEVCVLAFALHTDCARHLAMGCRPRDVFVAEPWPPGSLKEARV